MSGTGEATPAHARSRLALSAVAAILLFDAGASLVSRATGWANPRLGIGSLAIYAAVGFLAGRRYSVKLAVAVTMLTALAEATLGWAISWAIGPGRQAAVLRRPGLMAGIALTSVLAAALIGFFAGLLGAWVREGAPRDGG